MNFVSNKDFYQRIGRLDSARSKRNSTIVTAINKENGGINGLQKRPNRSASSSASKSVIDVNNEDSVMHQNRNTVHDTTSSNVIVALTEGRGYAQCEVGLAAMDVDCPSVLLCQFSDGFSYYGCITKLKIINPSQILIPLTIYNSGSKLAQVLKEYFDEDKITPVPRRHFKSEDGLQLIKLYCSPEFQNSLKFIEMKYYALSAASALLQYLKFVVQLKFLKNSLQMVYETRFARMLIDYDSCHRLELLYPLCVTKEKKSNLFGVLDQTVTAVGKRFLRARILEPFCALSNIEDMQQCIQELMMDNTLLSTLEQTLHRFSNADRILKMCIAPTETDQLKSVEIMLNQVLLLKTILENIPDLASLLRDAKSVLFRQFYTAFSDSRLSAMLMAIDEIIRPEVQFRKGQAQCFQRIHAIRSGINEFLDLVREMYTKLADYIRDTISELSVKHNLPFRMIYTTSRGFHIQLSLPKNSTELTIPSDLNILYKKGNNIYLSNPEIVKLNVRMEDVVKEIHATSDKIIRKLITDLMQYVDANYILVGAIAGLDIIQSLAKVSLNDDFCCPTFGDETRVVNARHPVLEYTRTKPTIVPNNILGTPEYNVFIITGPNMGGKTMYIKTIAILQIIAQMGCYVPATSASFRLCDRIFTRIGFEDNIEQNASSFQVEMREMEYIFRNITPNSLVVIDELCRSTNSVEGKELAWKLCEKLCLKMGFKYDDSYFERENKTNDKNKRIRKENTLNKITSPFIYITTHFLQLTKLADIYLNPTNLYLSAEESYVNDNLCLRYNHKVLVGINPIKGYGMSLARCIRFPERIIPRAHEILNHILFERESLARPKKTKAINPELRDLEKTLNITTLSLLKESNNTTNSYVYNFMNTSKNSEILLTNASENISIQEFLEDIECKLYDLYANIITYFRNKERNPDSLGLGDINSYIKDFLKSQPTDFITEISKNFRREETIELRSSIPEDINQFKENYFDDQHSKSNNTSIMKLNSTNIDMSMENLSMPRNLLKNRLASEDMYMHNVSSNSPSKIIENELDIIEEVITEGCFKRPLEKLPIHITPVYQKNTVKRLDSCYSLPITKRKLPNVNNFMLSQQAANVGNLSEENTSFEEEEDLVENGES